MLLQKRTLTLFYSFILFYCLGCSQESYDYKFEQDLYNCFLSEQKDRGVHNQNEIIREIEGIYIEHGILKGTKGQKDYYLNNMERYMNLKRNKPDFFPRENIADPKNEEKFRRPTAVVNQEKEWNKTRKEILLMVEKKNVVTRQDHRPLKKEMLKDLGFINPVKRHLRSRSPVGARNRNRNRK